MTGMKKHCGSDPCGKGMEYGGPCQCDCVLCTVPSLVEPKPPAPPPSSKCHVCGAAVRPVQLGAGHEGILHSYDMAGDQRRTEFCSHTCVKAWSDQVSRTPADPATEDPIQKDARLALGPEGLTGVESFENDVKASTLYAIYVATGGALEGRGVTPDVITVLCHTFMRAELKEMADRIALVSRPKRWGVWGIAKEPTLQKSCWLTSGDKPIVYNTELLALKRANDLNASHTHHAWPSFQWVALDLADYEAKGGPDGDQGPHRV
jgi:hypothetical protein